MWPFRRKIIPPEPLAPVEANLGDLGLIGKTRISPYGSPAGRVMATDGGPHPPSAWAQITAEHIAPIGASVAGARRRAAVRLQLDLANALEEHYSKVQDIERLHLAANDAHVLTPLTPEKHLADALDALFIVAAGTEWHDHFLKPEVHEAIRQAVATHIATAQHVERSWHVDRTLAKNPKHPHALAWLAQHHPAHPLLVKAK